MMNNKFSALVVREHDGRFSMAVEEVPATKLPKNDVLIKVSYSAVNYKDALSASGNKGVTKVFPHVPGIDAAGRVISSAVDQFSPGDRVLVTGYDLGMNTWGGFGQYISVPAGWVVKLPENLTPAQAMCFGTAGLTAGLSIDSLLNSQLIKHGGKIIVSGATGGVGSMAVAILSKLGYEVIAISGKHETDFLTETLGASAVIARDGFVQQYDAKAMHRAEFDGGIDTVGGAVLSGILKSVKYNGVVTCCGNVSSAQLTTSIFPFILRGARLIGIDSVEQPLAVKEKIWHLLANPWRPMALADMAQEITLGQLPGFLEAILKGEVKGRLIVRHDD